MKYESPLRYPGGKAALSRFLEDIIDMNDLRGRPYFEPFAGGAGAALSLLSGGVVSELFLNDYDPRVNAFWNAVLLESERFAEQIYNIPIDINEWKRQREVCENPKKYAAFDLGFATFYMNRCNRSGVVTRAGPIGGYKQEGKWRIDVRFNRENLAARVIHLGTINDRINVSGRDAIDFLRHTLPAGRGRRNVFVYLDPPYVSKGRRLYMNSYKAENHAELATYMLAHRVLPWVMSYDDDQSIRNLYVKCKRALMPVRYTLQTKRTERELVIAPHHTALPKACRFSRYEDILLKEIA